MAGRKRKPTNLKVIQGTAQPCRANKNEPKPDPDAPRAPHWLPDERATRYFGIIKERLSGMGLASKTFTEIIALAAQRMSEISGLNEVIVEEGATYPEKDLDKDGNEIILKIKAHPAVAQRNEALRHLHSLLASLGLSPADISKVSKLDLGKKGNKFSEL